MELAVQYLCDDLDAIADYFNPDNLWLLTRREEPLGCHNKDNNFFQFYTKVSSCAHCAVYVTVVSWIVYGVVLTAWYWLE